MKPQPGRMLISVHVPKCGGTTLLKILTEQYPGRVFLDYEEIPLDPECLFQKDFASWREKTSRLRPAEFAQIEVIHGHFWAGKYDGLFSSPLKITWLRDPIRRLVSHYYYWKAKETLPNSLHQLVHQKGFSLIDFAELPIMQNVYTHTFLRETALDEFHFVGLQEHFQEDLPWLSDRFGWSRTNAPCENRTLHPEYGAGQLDPALSHRIRQLNSEDLELYQRALELRAQRLRSKKFWSWLFRPATVP